MSKDCYVTIHQVIVCADSLMPNCFSHTDKVGWLVTFDRKIREEVIEAHEGTSENIQYEGDVAQRNIVVPEPYGMELYKAYLENTIDHYNGDVTRYNNSSERLSILYDGFVRWYRRNHTPLWGQRKYW